MPPVRRFQLLRSEGLTVGVSTGKRGSDFIIRTVFFKRDWRAALAYSSHTWLDMVCFISKRVCGEE
jgi:hypothetical protein